METSTQLLEAQEAVRECSFAVEFMGISTCLSASSESVYINVQTKENNFYCVELSVKGFKIVSRCFDKKTGDDEFALYYETMNSLLNQISPAYTQHFGNALASKLAQLKEDDGPG